MKLITRSFRGLERADIELGAITLIAGTNAQGKTSLAQSVVAATCDTMPIDGVENKYSYLLVNSGTVSADIILETDTGKTTVTYPDVLKISTGEPFEISRMAAGIDSFVDYKKPEERLKAFCDLLGALPPESELLAELKKCKAESGIKKLWDTIQVHGWDTAQKNAEIKGAELKADWKNITGEHWGSKKAEGWTHPDSYLTMSEEWLKFTEGREDKSEQENLSEFISLVTSLYEAANSDKSITEFEAVRLQKLADQVPVLNKEIEEINKSLKSLFKNEQDVANGIRNLPPAVQSKAIDCPHCKGKLQIENGMLSKVVILTEKEIAYRQKAIDENTESLKTVKAEIVKVNDQLNQKKGLLASAQAAATELSKKQKRRKSGDDVSSKVDELKAQLDTAQKRLDGIVKTNAATDKHKLIVSNLQIVEMLAPTGLRQVKLLEILNKFNEQLRKICEIAKWRTVEVKQNMMISMGAWPYLLCSKSEQFIVRVALQVAAAMVSSEKFIIIDDIDDLLDKARNGLMTVLAVLKIPSMIVLATVKKDTLPVKSINKIGGRCYWVDNGIAEEITAV